MCLVKTLVANPTTTWTLGAERHDLGQLLSELSTIAALPNAEHAESLDT